ncbi:hypothetical protein H5368_12385 [Luteimonas sp. MC1782]|uniref:hypothetical protein n=1 Tax=Luteimonas sp. MC1782 TaxID=2760305 RepID=UPI0016024C1E|nr:hypothetical protein [Luteimonas sp. MC1782]MBB1473830.1 hypothetical protein [Luteimonas sp. MC1782]
MMSVRSIFLAALLLVATPALAQQSIQAQMSADEFKAAGLDKLSTDELARLDAWLDRTIVDETGKAAAVAEERVKKEHRGFATFGSDEPVKGHIPGEFRGFQQGRDYTLDNGQVWRQVDGARLAGARLTDAEVTISPSLLGTAWYMQVGKYNTRAKVERIK